MGAAEWDDTKIPLAEARGFRAITIGVVDDSVIGYFFTKIPGWFAELANQQKPIWEESTGTSNIIPDCMSSLSIKEFVGCFSKKQFSPDEANKRLGSTRLPSLSKNIVSEEYSAKVSFLSHLNLTSTLEAVILQSGADSDSTAATSAVLR